MKERNERDKLERVASFRVSHTLGDDLETVARANNQNVQDLLRLAARALVRCHHEHGSIPLDMELRQRTWLPAAAAGAEGTLNEAKLAGSEKKPIPSKGRKPGASTPLSRSNPADSGGIAASA